MKNIFLKRMVLTLIITSLLVIPAIAKTIKSDDFDPLVDIEVSVEIQKIRAYDKEEKQLCFFPFIAINPPREYVDENSDPDFYVKVIIEGEEFISDTWPDTKYIYNPDFTATLNVPDEQEFIDITIQLWDWNEDGDVLCDIGDESQDIDITYSVKTGHWTGEDQIDDPSGYGRLSGCDDGSIYVREKDCELWFNVYQNDFDNDGIPYWTEVNEYGTDPTVNDLGDDSDNDDVPIEWEWKWGYDPFSPQNHAVLDPDGDSIDNLEEYLTSEWYSDPFRKDVFVELDIMDEGPDGEISYFPIGGKELIETSFNRQNIIFHLDYGEMGGHEMIPFDPMIEGYDLDRIYRDYFLHNDNDNWRRGVFHYGVVVYRSESAAGYIFRPNAFQISTEGHELILEDPDMETDVVYGSAYMHELGHTFAFWPIPGHTRAGGIFLFLYNLAYKSCMNYGYMYCMVDYSDGSRRAPDYDDWERMDLSYFENDWH